MDKKSVALVTGCSTGIGFETALLLAREGCRVFASMRDLKKSGPLREAAAGLPLEILQLDVDKPASVKKAVAHVLKTAGSIDVLVNNAGWGAFGALEEFTDQEILSQYETNVFGLMRLSKEVLPSMRANKSGRIIHIGSLAGKMTFTGIALYCSTKHAVEALTEGLRVEVRPFNIEVTVVEPGNIKTPFKANRRKALAFVGRHSLYQGVLGKVLEFGNRTSFFTPGPAKVAGKVLKAFRDTRMAVRYQVGLDSIWFPVVRWCLPDFVYDFLMRRLYGKFLKGNEPVLPQAARAEVSSVAREPVVLVTGANSGFGLEITRLLAQKGYRVYGTFRKRSKSEELFGLARSRSVFPISVDVTRKASVDAALRVIARKEGKLDLLINNAGFVTAGFLEDLEEGDLKRQFDTNLFGILRVTRASAPLLRAAGGGKVLNIGSISGRVVFPGIGAYAASKFAVRSLSEGLRMELRPFGIQVGEIAPGSFVTKVVSNTKFARNVKKGLSPYKAFLPQVEGLIAKEFKKAAPASEVAELVAGILKSGKVKPVYMAGTDAKVTAFLKKRLPDSWFEWFFSKIFTWSRFQD